MIVNLDSNFPITLICNYNIIILFLYYLFGFITWYSILRYSCCFLIFIIVRYYLFHMQIRTISSLHKKKVIWTISLYIFNIKGQPGALKLPHSQGPGRGPTIWCIIRSLTLFLHKRLFLGLEPVTLRSHDNNFTSCTKVTPLSLVLELSGWPHFSFLLPLSVFSF